MKQNSLTHPALSGGELCPSLLREGRDGALATVGVSQEIANNK